MFSDLSFRYPFRKYQRMVLDTIVPESTDRKYHIVSPPGSGKTIIGLELVRRFAQPAVIFAPTTTIQQQWREKLGLFVADEARLDSLVSLNPQQLRPINIFTYQLISAPSRSPRFLRAIAREMWLQELVEEGLAADEQAARQRLEKLKTQNLGHYRRELGRRALRAKRKLLYDSEVNLADFLHPNARRLIDDLVAYGVQTIVLDECHHLLDYWAIVLRHLIGRISAPRVIGLTATLPSPEGDDAFDNYNALLGEVDFEVPTPAVVKDGDLAPYRDLALFVKPTAREREYLRDISQHFTQALQTLTSTPDFQEWVRGWAFPPDRATWLQRWNERAGLMLAACRYAGQQGWSFVADWALPTEAHDPLQLEDWLTLIEGYARDVLMVSAAPEKQALLRTLRDTLYGFGFTLTERGLRQVRSAGDMLLTFSESKDYGAALILEKEYKALGEKLRAVLITDFERLNSGMRKLRQVMGRDAGSAWRLFHHLVQNPRLQPLHPVLVTGKTVRCGIDWAESLVAANNRRLQADGSAVRCRVRPDSQAQGAVSLVGEGRAWKPSVYVPLLTSLFDEGQIQCLVGTRGILGEGWDAVKVNTLIDLTSVTTSTSVQQLRGRSLRKDPDWPRKVAHNWDVICVAPDFERGLIDFDRFLRRHARYWGLALYPKNSRAAHQNEFPHKQVVRGWRHVHPELLHQVYYFLGTVRGFGKVNQQMLAAIPQRDWVYEAWEVGSAYSNFNYQVTQIQPQNLKIRTVFTLQETVAQLVRAMTTFAAEVFGLAALLWWGAGYPSLAVALWLGGFLLAIATLVTMRRLWQVGRRLFSSQPVDAILLDVARAVLVGLQQAGMISRHLTDDFIRLLVTEDGRYQVLLDYASEADASLFAQSLREVFEPVRDQRYLIWRTDARLPRVLLRPFWWALRLVVQRGRGYPAAYYPVPRALARKRAYAEAFAAAWRQYVGGGRLVFTRNPQGREILLQARAQKRPLTRQDAFSVWR